MSKTITSYPEIAFSVLTSKPTQVIAIRAHEAGYYELSHFETERDARAYADQQNKANGVSHAYRRAMEVGSMFGWDTPGADPSSPLATSARSLADSKE